MDKSLKQILNQYSSPKVDSQVRELSKTYLEKYWLNLTEYNNYWRYIKNNIFNSESVDLPDLMFNKNYELIAQRGGLLFIKEEYEKLQKCMLVAGDNFFVLIENEFVRNSEGDFPYLRFKFPVNTTWDEINNGDENFPDISFETIFIMNKHFFVFGDSGKWGKYTASDYGDTPIDIIGFKPELEHIFKKYFKQPKEEFEEIHEWLPLVYKELIK